MIRWSASRIRNGKVVARESDIQDALLAHMRRRKIFCWEDCQPKQVGGKRVGSTKGVSDLHAIYLGWPMAVEVKRPEGQLSVAQFNWLTEFRAEGGIAIVCTSVEDFERQIQDLRIRPRGAC